MISADTRELVGTIRCNFSLFFMLLSFELLSHFRNLTHFSTMREGGVSRGSYTSFNLSPYSGDDLSCFQENKRRLCVEINIPQEKLFIPFQTHGTEILEIDDSFLQSDEILQQKMLYGVDALYTKKKNICIGITTADCVPLFFYDAQKEIIAVAHAGWRGTADRIAEKLVQTFKKKYKSDPENIFVVIGPSISVNAYRVGEELVPIFARNGFPIASVFKETDRQLHLDLWEANKCLLIENGIPERQIEISGVCTYSQSEYFFSARKLSIESGRILSGIMMR